MADEREQQEEVSGVRGHARVMKEELSPSKLNSQLEDAVAERPMVRFLLEPMIVLRAAGIALVVALLLWLLLSAKIAAIALIVVFAAAWVIGAQMSYERRRETTDASIQREGEGDGDGEPEPEPAGERG